MITVGLTGGIASGKTMIEEWFEEVGIPVYDADRIYKKLAEKGEVLYNKIIDAFGDGFLDRNGAIDWQKLGRRVFSDKTARNRLNQLTHPIIKDRFKQIKRREKKENSPIIVFSVPLLYEADFVDLVDVVIVVYVDETTQIKRLRKRDDITKKTARKKINAQMPLDIKKSLADIVIDNRGTPVATKKRFEEVLGMLRSET